jgi:hypothetical protein
VIVRILGEGQYEVDDSQRGALDQLDDALMATVDGGDEAGFATALGTLVSEVRRTGTPLDDDAFTPSDLVVPFVDATLEETKGLLAQPGDGGGSDPG